MESASVYQKLPMPNERSDQTNLKILVQMWKADQIRP